MNTEYVLRQLELIGSSVGFERISLGSSLDGIGGLHDRLRGRKGAFDMLMNSAKAISAEHPELYLSFNYTLVPENAGSLFDVYKFAKENALNVSFQCVVDKSETEKQNFAEDTIRILDRQIDNIIEYIWNERKWPDFNVSMLFDNLDLMFTLLNLHYMYEYIKEPKRFFKYCPCGRKFAMIDPLGNLYLCPVNKHMLCGNIREADFDMIWEGARCSGVRNFISKNECHCWLSCTCSSMLAQSFFPHKDEIIKLFER